MAHFAELKAMTDPTGFTSDSHQVVQRVVVVGNDVVPSDMHADGETWCINFFKGGIWKQTSYNHNFRKQYAGKGSHDQVVEVDIDLHQDLEDLEEQVVVEMVVDLMVKVKMVLMALEEVVVVKEVQLQE